MQHNRIREQTKILDDMERIASLKWRWIGHIMGQGLVRWIHKITFWNPRHLIESIGRLLKRWIDDVKTTD